MSNLRFIASQDVILPKWLKWNDAITEFCKKEHFAFLSDRFGYLNQFSNVRAAEISKDKFPTGNLSLSFYDIIVNHASSIAKHCLTNNKKCYVMWSGGCDSTSILSAFLECGYELSFLNVLYTKSSIEEFPDFFYFIKDKICMELLHSLSIYDKAISIASEGNIVLTGFPADQLFGSIIGQSYPKDTTKTHWTEFLNKDIANQQYEAAFQYYGIPVKTIAEFLWFNNFALKWDYVCRSGLWMNNIDHKNIIPFYDTREFEEWSVANYDILHKYDQKDYKNYKIQMKDFIYKTTKIKSVYNLKKIPSFGYAYDVDDIKETIYPNKLSYIDDENNIEFINIDKKSTEIQKLYGLYCMQIFKKFLKEKR